MICNEFLLWRSEFHVVSARVVHPHWVRFLNPARPDHHVIDHPTRFDILFRFSRWITYTSLIISHISPFCFQNCPGRSSSTWTASLQSGNPLCLFKSSDFNVFWIWFQLSQIPIRWIHQSLESHGPFSVMVTAWQTLMSDTSRQFMWNMLPYDAVPILRIPTSICQVSCRVAIIYFCSLHVSSPVIAQPGLFRQQPAMLHGRMTLPLRLSRQHAATNSCKAVFKTSKDFSNFLNRFQQSIVGKGSNP